MPDLTKEPARQLALNTDWLTALNAAGAFFICGLLGLGTTWMTLHGTFKVPSASWWSMAFTAYVIYLAIAISAKLYRIGIAIFSLGRVFRIVLWLAGASDAFRLTSEIFIRWIDTTLCFAVCMYVVYWFKIRITYV